ncbi:MAG: IMP dehydrogenase [Candidatus Nanoarchaeia archaeon]|nr:IMP dehydrogenase [Candidatus Nanoarchaeia archaeon]
MNKHIKKFFEYTKKNHLGITFGDVLLVPKKSDILPSEVNLETRVSRNTKLNIPVISADMSTVTEGTLARELAKKGGIGFIWKCPDLEKQLGFVDEVKYAFNAKIDNPVTINENQTIGDYKEIIKRFKDRFSSLVVLDNENKVVGLLGRHEVRFPHKDSDLVKNHMNKDILKHEGSLDLNEAYNFMGKNRISKLVLINRNGELNGLYSWDEVRSIIENKNPMYNLDEKGRLIVGANVGIHDYKRAEALLNRGCDVLVVGTAHGHTKNVIETVRELKRTFRDYKFDVVAGNLISEEGAKDLIKAGADALKVGIGPSGICTTRIVTGAGFPQLSAIYYVSKIAEKYDIPVIGDGGIEYSGDITKALAAGASSVMMGGLFAQTQESAGERVIRDGKIFKEYYGMGSERAMNMDGSKERYRVSGKSVSEGIESNVPLSKTVDEMVNDLIGGVKHGMGYVGAKDIKTLHEEQAEFIRMTNAGYRESHIHGVLMTKEQSNYAPK